MDGLTPIYNNVKLELEINPEEYTEIGHEERFQGVLAKFPSKLLG